MEMVIGFLEMPQVLSQKKKVLMMAIYPPLRSLLLLSGETCYGWHHHIPHHEVRAGRRFMQM